jgi:hypothetical protein
MLENLDDCVCMTGRCMIEMQASRRYIPCRRVYATFILIPSNGNKGIGIQCRKVVVKLKKREEVKKGEENQDTTEEHPPTLIP